MGHIRLKRLPSSRKWHQVVALLTANAPVDEIAAASADASERALQSARNDPALAQAFWLLTQIPLAARAPDFAEAVRRVGVNVGPEPSLMEVVAALSEAVDRESLGRAGHTDLGEMARKAAAESLAVIAGGELPTLFVAMPNEVRQALGKLAAPDHFARLARDFFARLTKLHLDYYLSRTIPQTVGLSQSLATTADHSAFNAALDQHCREASKIVEAFSGGWFSKTQYQGGITPKKARAFVFVALGNWRFVARPARVVKFQIRILLQ